MAKHTMADANAQLTELYVRQMANELSQLARSAGCRRLSAFLTLASSAAETSLPAFHLTSDFSPRSNKSDQTQSARAPAGNLTKPAR
jgi:hypothetical protein